MDLREWLKKPGNSQEALAERMGCSQSLISQHLAFLEGKSRDDGATRITAERCLCYENATNREVTRHDLRPDLFGKPQRSGPKHSRAAA